MGGFIFIILMVFFSYVAVVWVAFKSDYIVTISSCKNELDDICKKRNLKQIRKLELEDRIKQASIRNLRCSNYF